MTLTLTFTFKGVNDACPECYEDTLIDDIQNILGIYDADDVEMDFDFVDDEDEDEEEEED